MPSLVDDEVPVEDGISPQDLEVLLQEMGTTPESLRRDAVALREWIVAQPHLPDLGSEHDSWLETFLIAGKNSMEKAKARLDNYFSNRATMGDWYCLPPPPEDKALVDHREFLIGGYLPRTLPGGHIVIIEKVIVPPDGDWSRFDVTSHIRRGLINTECFTARGRKTRGCIFVMDEKDVNMSVVTSFMAAVGAFRKLMFCIQDAMPLRINSIHLINAVAPSIQRMVLGTIKPMMKGKLADRIYIHDGYETLHEYIPPEYLPAEYGGTSPATMDSICEAANNFLLNQRELLESRAWMKSDESRRIEKKTSDTQLEGSFRKLDVD